MTKLWLTYAWKDNETEQVDFVVQKLREFGLKVDFDRAHLIPGQRLWPQIDRAISDPAVSDGWAIYATKNSLSSEPCQEELAYALDRALRTRGQTFPIIGIFPEPLDRSIIPSAIATRLWVSLRDPGWAAQVAAGARGERPEVSTNVAPYILSRYQDGDREVMEVRPRSGRWYPFWALVPRPEFDAISLVVWGPYGVLPGATMVSQSEVELRFNQSGEEWKGMQIGHAIDPLNSAFVYFSRPPSKLIFGQANGECFRLPLGFLSS